MLIFRIWIPIKLYLIRMPKMPSTDTEKLSSLSENTYSATNDEPVNDETHVAKCIVEEIGSLTHKLNEKYPELTALSSMTLDEINALYPTAEEKAVLMALSEQAQTEFRTDFRDLFSMVSPEVIDESFAIVRRMFAENWGTDTADQVIDELRRQLEL